MTTPSLRSLAISLAGLALVAGPAWSARVVQVRVGNHPTFTRVVFELDARAGYQIERREVDGGQELVVTLAAASTPRKLSSRSAMIAGVEVEPSGKESVARVRLRRSVPLVKEMILASPPRIVLDLMLPEDLAGATGAPKPAPAPTTAAAPKTTEEPATPAPRVVAKKDAPDLSRPPAEPAKPETKGGFAPEPGPAPKPAAPVVKATPPDAAAAPPQKVEPPAPSPRAVATPPAPAPVARVETALEGERIVETKPAPPDGGAATGTAEATPAPVAPAGPEPLPPVAKPPEAVPPRPIARAAPAPTAPKPGFFSAPFGLRVPGSNPWLTMALVGAGALLFLIVVAILLRRHSRPTSLDALQIARQPDELEGMGDSFATGAAHAGADIGAPRDAFPAAGSGLFDDETEKGDMEMAAQFPIERERARISQSPAGADSDVAPLVRELERRMGQLESRLDQMNEARERLERQVTAQSEELRVQRAAIARTQRALRGMNRGGEEQATEPALRDPSKPPSGRS